MNAVFFVPARPYKRAPGYILCGLLVLVSLGASSAIAQTGAALEQQLDSIAGAGVRENRAVGIVAAVVKGNDALLLKAYGKAVVESDSAATVDTVFQLGSDTKQFTAAAILQLRDHGKLALDDDITKWLPDFETHGNKVTLRHLLGHTSGRRRLDEQRTRRTYGGNRASGGRSAAGAAPGGSVHG